MWCLPAPNSPFITCSDSTAGPCQLFCFPAGTTLTLSGEGIGKKLRKDGASFLSLSASLGSSSCHTAAYPAFSSFGFAAPVLGCVPSSLCSHGSCSPLSEHRWHLSHLPHPPCAFVYLHPTGVSRHLTQIPYLRPCATQPFSSSCSWDGLCDPPARLGHLRPEDCFLLRFPPSWTLARCFLPTCLLGTSSGQCNLDTSPTPFAATTLAPAKSMQVLGRGFFPSVFFLVLALGPQLFLTDLVFFCSSVRLTKDWSRKHRDFPGLHSSEE